METKLNSDRNLLEIKEAKIQKLFTEREASDYLRVSTVTLWRERKAGKITFRRVASKIIYLQEDLDVYLEKNKREAFASN
jgi:hypothetical protein